MTTRGTSIAAKTPSNRDIKEFDLKFEPRNAAAGTEQYAERSTLSLNLSESRWMGVEAKGFGNNAQRAFYRLFRSLWNSRMYPLDVKRPKDFHTNAHWGAKRGQPIGRYYLHRWLREIDKAMANKGPLRCLEIGDGHFIKSGGPRAWKQRAGKMLTFCSGESLSLDLSDPRADLHANLESPYTTLKEKHQVHQLRKGFDVVVCAQVFEHIDSPLDAIQGLASLVRPGGTILLSVPFLGNPVHGHDVHRFTTTGVANLARKAGLDVISNQAMGNSLTTIGYLLDLASDDFTEDELMAKDPHQYVGVYAVLKKSGKDFSDESGFSTATGPSRSEQ